MANCGVCGCLMAAGGIGYAGSTPHGRSHRSKHHYVAERFFGRSANRRGTQRDGVFSKCPWDLERKSGRFCYECHELLLHNPVFLPADIQALGRLVRTRGLSEASKPTHQRKIAGRIKLLHEVIEAGLAAVEARAGKNVL